MKRIIPVVIALALVAAACGGDDSSDTTVTTLPATTTTVAPATTTTTAAPTTTTSSTTTLPINPNISANDTVSTAGLGPIRIGMNPQEANIAAGYGLELYVIYDSLYFLCPERVVCNVGFMVGKVTFAGVDIFPG